MSTALKNLTMLRSALHPDKHIDHVDFNLDLPYEPIDDEVLAFETLYLPFFDILVPYWNIFLGNESIFPRLVFLKNIKQALASKVKREVQNSLTS